MDIILISGSVLSLVLAIFLLVKKKEKLLSDKVLAFWLLIFSLDFLRCYMLFFKGKLFLLGFGYTLPLLIAPLLYLYVVLIIDNKKRFELRFLWHMIPFVLVNIYMFFYIYSKPPAWRIEFFEETSFVTRPILFNFILFIVVIVYPVYILWIYKLLKKHVKKIDRIYSCHDQIDLYWVNYLLVSAIVIWALSLYSKFVSGYFNSLHYSNTTMMIYFFELIIIMIVGYFGFKQGIIFIGGNDLINTSEEKVKYKTSGFSSDAAKDFLPVLLNFMETKKPYLDSRLSISDLADQIEIPSYQLSQIINGQLGKNFFEFVNSYRVEEVKRRILDNQDKKFTLLALAFDSGFNSKSSFNSIFKKHTGLTPKEYMNRKIAA
jgi:AraC-like DNA-binding protein